MLGGGVRFVQWSAVGGNPGQVRRLTGSLQQDCKNSSLLLGIAAGWQRKEYIKVPAQLTFFFLFFFCFVICAPFCM